MELYRRGGALPQDQLSPVDSLSSLHLLEPGSGDYTAELQAKEDEGTLEELCGEIRGFVQGHGANG